MNLNGGQQASSPFDLVVVGGGIGGLATAALAQRLGLRTALLEAHTKLGGCAGYFCRGDFTFDVGATALVGCNPGEPIGDVLAFLDLDFQTEASRAYRIVLPDRTFDMVADRDRFEHLAVQTFTPTGGLAARRLRVFWRLQEALGEALFRAAARVPRLPVRSLGDLLHDVRILGPVGMLAGATANLTVENVLRILGLKSNLAFRSLIAMLLEDTAQAGAEIVPFANAAACLQAYRRGMSRPRGGMQSLAETIGQSFAALGGDLRMATLVDRVEPIAGSDQNPRSNGNCDSVGFVVTTRRRQRIYGRQVALNLPLNLAARLLHRSLVGRLDRRERQSRAVWSAFTGYLAIDRAAVPDDSPLFHQLLQSYDQPTHDGNNVLVSLSPLADGGYGPPTVRVATMSTHTRPADWQDLDKVPYRNKKKLFRERFLSALGRALPEAPAALVHAEFASPRSFERYTRRLAGGVGGAPVSRSNSNFFAVDSDVFGPGIWIVGDSVFPGQGTMASVLSGIRVVERITHTSWDNLRKMNVSQPEPVERRDSVERQVAGIESEDGLVSQLDNI